VRWWGRSLHLPVEAVVVLDGSFELKNKRI
jgi:hypothetical protein